MSPITEQTILTYVFFAGAACGLMGVIFSIYGFIRFDRVLKHLYVTNRDAWIQLGMPYGFFWIPPEARRQWISSGLARSRAVLSNHDFDLLGQGDVRMIELRKSYVAVRRIGNAWIYGALSCLLLVIIVIFGPILLVK